VVVSPEDQQGERQAQAVTFIVAENTQSGPVVTLWVGWDIPLSGDSLNKGIEPPAWVPVRMLVDTGATISSIAGDVLQKLNLTTRGTIGLRTASLNFTESRPTYHVSLHLFDDATASSHPMVQVIEYAVGSDGVQGLLGWDVLQHCTMIHRKEDHRFTLEF